MSTTTTTGRTVDLGTGLQITIDERGDAAASPRRAVRGVRPGDRRPIPDIRPLPPAAVGRLPFHGPAFRPDPSALTDEQRAGAAANQQALAHYAGDDFLFAPKLRRRLRRVTVPV